MVVRFECAFETPAGLVNRAFWVQPPEFLMQVGLESGLRVCIHSPKAGDTANAALGTTL